MCTYLENEKGFQVHVEVLSFNPWIYPARVTSYNGHLPLEFVNNPIRYETVITW